MITELGNEYFGNFKDGKLEGFGFLISSKGNFYLGNFKSNQFHGKGEFFNFAGELKVSGEWEEGKPKSGN